jgi:hypothetical protein
MADPFTEPLPEHQAQITEAQHVAEQGLRVGVQFLSADNG